MFDIALREFKDFFVDPCIAFLKRLKISPNYFTLSSGLCGMLIYDIDYPRLDWSLLFKL